MRFFDFPIVRFSLFLALGIICSAWQPWSGWLVLFCYSIPLLIISWVLARRNLFQKPFFGIITYLSFLCLGAANHELRSPEHQPNHFTHFISEVDNPKLVLEILSDQKPNKFNHRFIVEVKSVDSFATHGKILVYLQKDSTKTTPLPGSVITLFAQPKEIPEPLNPGQFNYSNYLKSKDIYRQLRIQTEDIFLMSEEKSFLSRIQKMRSLLLQRLEVYPFGEQELSIIKALTLGHRNSIDRELYKSYAAAGAIHVLAVSGLHVGIIYFILQWLFKPLHFVPKGRKIIVLLIVMCLIFYALITGLSPSVTRAVTMFSFFGMAQLLNRPTNSINTLFLSFFFLLLWNPKWLYDVGFQLSYVAVFFILWLHPKITIIYRPRFFGDRIIWNTLTVSFCAQLGVAPLTIFYFNQFPGLFLLSNLVILPFIGVLVGAGLSLLILSSLGIGSNWFAEIVSSVIGQLNRFVVWISEQEHFIFKDLVISEVAVLASYVLIISLIVTSSKYNFLRFRFLLISVLFFLTAISPMKFGQKTDRLIIFHKTRQTLAGIQKNRSLLVLTQDSTSVKETYPIASFRSCIRARFYSEEIIPSVIRYNENTIMVVDSSGIYPKDFPVDVVLLSGSPKIHLDMLIEELQPKRIIADGSNYRSYVARWRETCKNRKLPFHHTGDSGAFILE